MKLRYYTTLLLFTSMVLYSCSEKYDNDFKSTASLKLSMNNKEINVPLNYRVKEQLQKERVFRNLELKREFQIGSINDSILLYPISVNTDDHGTIYILDQLDCKVKVFNSKGVFLKSYGSKGKGPGEMLKPYRIDVSPQSHIIVTDIDQMKCVYFKGEQINEIKLKYSPECICFMLNNSYCILQSGDLISSPMLATYNLKGEKILKYDDIVYFKGLSEKPPFITTLDGEVITFNNNVYYMPRYLNHFVAFNETGKIRFSVKTIDDVKNLPTAFIGSAPGGGVYSKYPERESLLSLGCGIVNDKIWIASRPALIKYKKKVFDIYSPSDGSYQYSYITDDIGSFRRLFLTSNRVYIIQADGSVMVMKIIA